MGIHGAMWGGSDEIIGTIKGLLNPDITVQEGIAARRKDITEAREKFPRKSITSRDDRWFCYRLWTLSACKGCSLKRLSCIKKDS